MTARVSAKGHGFSKFFFCHWTEILEIHLCALLWNCDVHNHSLFCIVQWREKISSPLLNKHPGNRVILRPTTYLYNFFVLFTKQTAVSHWSGLSNEICILATQGATKLWDERSKLNTYIKKLPAWAPSILNLLSKKGSIWVQGKRVLWQTIFWTS